MIDVLRKYTPSAMQWNKLPQHVVGTLAKILLCRTAVLKGRTYKCDSCHHKVSVYNSCTDRHCPQCGGAKRAEWLDRAKPLVLQRANYFQVVFTLPDGWSPLILGNRQLMYDLLFRSAWRALKQLLRKHGRFQPAALMVLHTWNQELDHHPHIHAIVPGGGPALDGDSWKESKHPDPKRTKPFLVNNEELGELFRKKFIAGFKRLVQSNKLHLEGEWSQLRDPLELEPWLKPLKEKSWNVYVEGSRHDQQARKQTAANPQLATQNLLMYLARYLTGGPIADSRLVRDDGERVTFMARPKGKRKRTNRQPREFSLPGKEFVRRWALHVLPKGYTRSRSYGGFHPTNRQKYMSRCRDLLNEQSPAAIEESQPSDASTEPTQRLCPRCESTMALVENIRRPSWSQVFERHIYATDVYSPTFHIGVAKRSQSAYARWPLPRIQDG